jgi:hypothetical protein
MDGVLDSNTVKNPENDPFGVDLESALLKLEYEGTPNTSTVFP